MPERSEIEDWHYATQKGRIASFVARGRGNPSMISKTLKTLGGKGELSEQDLNRIILEVEKETIEAFANDASYASRKERLARLREELK